MGMLARSLYRSRQFFGSLRPRVDEGSKEEAVRLLSGPQRELFDSMVLRDQKHCLDVYNILRQDTTDRDLLTAALLHDCGKGRISVWHRVAFVLLDAAAPGLLSRIVAPGDGGGWRQALYRCQHHDRLGADLARRAGCSDATVALIRGDSSAPHIRESLAALEAADDSV
jgi:hypothetical protein